MNGVIWMAIGKIDMIDTCIENVFHVKWTKNFQA